MRHGLLAETIVLSNEDPVVFKKLIYIIVARFTPVDDVEMSMVEEMAACCWRLRRAFAMESCILESGISSWANQTKTPIEQTTAAFCAPANKDDLSRLERYQVRIQGMYQRALRGLAQIRKIPRQPAPQPDASELVALLPNEPTPPNVCNTSDAIEPLPATPDAPLTPAAAIAAL